MMLSFICIPCVGLGWRTEGRGNVGKRRCGSGHVLCAVRVRTRIYGKGTELHTWEEGDDKLSSEFGHVRSMGIRFRNQVGGHRSTIRVQRAATRRCQRCIQPTAGVGDNCQACAMGEIEALVFGEGLWTYRGGASEVAIGFPAGVPLSLSPRP